MYVRKAEKRGHLGKKEGRGDVNSPCPYVGEPLMRHSSSTHTALWYVCQMERCQKYDACIFFLEYGRGGCA